MDYRCGGVRLSMQNKVQGRQWHGQSERGAYALVCFKATSRCALELPSMGPQIGVVWCALRPQAFVPSPRASFTHAISESHTYTHRADLLDPALMRPGRFDRKVRMPKPDTNGRYEILQLHLRKKQVRVHARLPAFDVVGGT
eukprot:1159559-Pelagomonas_calceolata.AAC.2